MDPNHGGIIQQMSFTLIGPISMRDLPDVIGSENGGEFRGKKKESKTQPLQCGKLRKSTMFTVHRLGLRQLELNKKHHLHYTFQDTAGMSCNTASVSSTSLVCTKVAFSASWS